ncbi:hypothetical protein RFI_25972, partial [Reticulomyxa filosa]
SQSQCVLRKHEILICGGWYKGACYSYHTLKNEYKFICEYPSHVQLKGNCVVKLEDNDKDKNQITLLSFGSDLSGESKHTLVMKYVSVWSNSKKLKKLNNYNKWIPFTDNHNDPIIIGRDRDRYQGARAVIGGINKNLLFITYFSNNISVFDLNTFQFIKHDTLPTKSLITYHCFVSSSGNGQEQKMMKTNKQNDQMLLFCRKTGLSIEYDEDNNTFQFRKLSIHDFIAPFYKYAYVCINDVILFFGGYDDLVYSKLVHKYSIRKNKWMKFKNTLPSPLRDCVAILSKEDNHIHILGGIDDKKTISKDEMKFITEYWIRTLKIKLGWINDFDEIILKYIR